MIRNRIQIPKHEATMATETVTSMRKTMRKLMRIDTYTPVRQVVDGGPTSKKRGMTVPETEKTLLQTNSAPETSSTPGSQCDQEQVHREPGSEREVTFYDVCLHRRKHHRMHRTHNQLQPTISMESTAPNTSG
jgi:hypothetical protein